MKTLSTRSFVVFTASFLLSFYSAVAFAAGPVVTGVSGASSSTLTGTPIIYGGLAGDELCESSSSSTCNNCRSGLTCSTTPLCACNEARINGNLVLTITATPQESATGALRLIADDVVISPTGTSSTSSASFTWDTLCQASTAGTTCENVPTTQKATLSARIFNDNNNSSDVDDDEEATTISFYIINPGKGTSSTWNVYGATNTEGVGGFTPYPGDEKIYIEDVTSTSGFPTLSYGSKAVKVRVWISDNGAATASPTSAIVPSDLDVVDDGGTLESNKVTGLTNGTAYVFRVALIDEAGNIVQHYPSASDATANGCDTNPPSSSCPWAATPDEVLGLLSEDFNCFVATAAYGTQMSKELSVFRDFRHRILLRTDLGKYLVNKYYSTGPKMARWIASNENLKMLSRGVLWPLHSLAKLTLKLPLSATVQLTIYILSVLFIPLLTLLGFYLAARRIFRSPRAN